MKGISNKYDNAVIYGSRIKLLLTVSIDGVSMSTVDFNLNLKIGQKEILLKKEELIKLDDKNYLICLKEKDTEITNKSIPAEITLYIPDEDFDDGINIKKLKTIIDLVILK